MKYQLFLGDKEYSGVLENLSASGVRLATSQPTLVGDERQEGEIALFVAEEAAIRVRCRIISLGNGDSAAGLDFIDPPTDAITSLIERDI
jgi:hypothetical protein